jgi:hypothetical protein
MNSSSSHSSPNLNGVSMGFELIMLAVAVLSLIVAYLHFKHQKDGPTEENDG